MDETSFLWLLLTAVVHSEPAYKQPMHFNVTEEISDNLFLFLDQTMEGCTIKTVMNKESIYSEDVYLMLNNLNTGYKTPTKTYMLEKYVAYTNPLLNVNEYGQYVVHSEYQQPEWLFKRHTSCYCHLYLVENAHDLLSAIRYHFVDFDLRRETPNYVVLWDLFDVHSSYKSMFSKQEFHGTFMDYRLVIRKSIEKRKYDVSLVCIICAFHTPQKPISNLITPATIANIHKSWKRIHSNHFGLKELACNLCMNQSEDLKLNYRLLPLEWLITVLLNITMFNPDDAMEYTNSLSTFSHRHFARTSIDNYMLRPRYPSFVWSISHSNSYGYNMFTVVHKSLLAPSGLTGLLAPFHKYTWIAIIVFGAFLIIILSVARNDIRYSLVFLLLFGPLTDHWIRLNLPQLNRILLLWGILSYSVTVLYAGDLASSIAVLKPPEYPTRPSDLGHVRSQLISTATAQYYTNDPYVSRYADVLSVQMADWSRSKARRADEIDTLAELISELRKAYCDPLKRVYNRSNEEYPFRCLNKPHITKHEIPITFVDYGHYYISIRFAFQDSSAYWLSPSIRVEDQQEDFILVMRKNYFAKLVLPIASSWMESGFQEISNRVRRHISPWSNVSTPSSFKVSDPTNVLTFTPWKLWSHKSILILTAILLGVAMLVFQAERLSGLDSTYVFCISKLELRLQFQAGTVVEEFRNET